VDGHKVEFSGGFDQLHTDSYRQILADKGFGLEDARPSIDTVYAIRKVRGCPDCPPVMTFVLEITELCRSSVACHQHAPSSLRACDSNYFASFGPANRDTP
jgi:hypothetical protein